MAERRRSAFDRLLAAWRPVSAVLAAVIAMNVLVHVLVIRRTGAVSGDREMILASARDRLRLAREEADGHARTSSKLACAKSDVAHVFDDLLSSKEERMTAIQREVRKLAADRGLDPARITYNATEIKDTGLVRFTIAFPLNGTYATLQDFVKAVEDSPNFLIVDNIVIDETDGSSLSLQVQLATYFQGPDAERLARAFVQKERS